MRQMSKQERKMSKCKHWDNVKKRWGNVKITYQLIFRLFQSTGTLSLQVWLKNSTHPNYCINRKCHPQQWVLLISKDCIIRFYRKCLASTRKSSGFFWDFLALDWIRVEVEKSVLTSPFRLLSVCLCPWGLVLKKQLHFMSHFAWMLQALVESRAK